MTTAKRTESVDTIRTGRFQTSAERMRVAMLGEPVDRVPIWLREGFDFHGALPAPDHFSLGWRADPQYAALREFAEAYCDMRIDWAPGQHFNRFLGIPGCRIRSEVTVNTSQLRRIEGTIDTPKGALTFVNEQRRGVQTTWCIKPPVCNLDDLEKLRSVPFEVEPVRYDGYDRQREQCGDRGILCLGLSSPCVVISGCMPFELFLTWSLTERTLMRELLAEVTDRILQCLEAVFSRPLETAANLGGSEQCTPPMMPPDAFDEFVVPYDAQIVAFLKQRGVPVNCHCHGKVRNALRGMIQAGFDSTDPVEPPPAGDVSIEEARAVAGDDLTLVGNFEFDELESATPDHIRARVREILATGKRRLILAASAGPISHMSPQLMNNYRAWIEEAVACGRCA